MNKISALGITITTAIVSSFVSLPVSAAGFALIENSASGMGNAFAGGSAIAEDASTVWFNPAGMTRLSGSQIMVAGHFISTAADFTNQGSLNAGGGALAGPSDDGGTSALVPNFYYVTQLEGEAWFGVGVTVPFGLSTEYDENWVGRYGATESEVETLNINPSFAFKYSENLSVGLGLNLQYIESTLANHIDSALTCVGLMTSPAVGLSLAAAQNACITVTGLNPGDVSQDSSQSLSGDDWNLGWNIGFLYDLDEASRLGLAYRSSIDANLRGDVNFTVDPTFQTFINANFGGTPLAAFLTDSKISAGIELPAQLSVSYVRDFSPELTFMADITWTEWSNFNALVVKFDNLVQPTSTTPENWEDSYRFAIGASYQSSDKVLLRAGIAHDQTPIPSAEDRTARIPGDDRTWLSFGVGYQLDANTSIDVGYSHLFVDDTRINNTDTFGHTLTGEYDADVDILSVQGNFKF